MGRPRTIDLSGVRFSFLTVIGRSESYSNNQKWSCVCDCGNICETTLQRLKNGRAKSCGCKKSELISKANTLHGATCGGSGSPEYQSYVAMMHRCYDSTRDSWEHYGGRGVIVEESSWLEESPKGFLNFLADMGNRPEGTSLDRIDTSGNYSKENCRWADRRTQSYNTRIFKTDKSTSKYRGVSFSEKRNKKWMARIGNGAGGYIYIGQFDTEEEAALAYNDKAIEIHGENAILNEVCQNIEPLDTMKSAGIIVEKHEDV